MTDEEQKKMKNEYVVLVARILVEFLSCLNSLKSVIPKHIQHEYSEEMSQKSTIIISMPVVPFNQNKTFIFVKLSIQKKVANKIIHGQFVNPKGGEGNNYANDLKQEHLVKGNKTVLKGLCGNKTLAAVTRSTKCAHSLKINLDNFDEQSTISPDSVSHTYDDAKKDIKEMVEILHSLKPFQHAPGRNHSKFPTLSNIPFDQLDPVLLDTWLTRNKKALAKNSFIE